MGAIAGLVGLGGGAAGSSFNINQGVNTNQANQAYGQTQQALQGQQGLLNALQAQNGLGLQNQAAQGFENLASGTGPNPAQAQLAQNTAANVAQTAALQAGQRGASQNVGLLARQIGQQGAATQQQGVGQAATQQANQQIAGLQGLAGQANTIAGQQIGQTNANTQAAQGQYSNVLNALGQLNTANAGLANTQMQGQQGLLGGVLNSVGSIFQAEGGDIQKMADGGPTLGVNTNLNVPGPSSEFGQFLNKVSAPTAGQQQPQSGPAALQQGANSLSNAVISGAKGALGLNKGGMATDYRGGGHIEAKTPDQKATVKGDSYSNDKIPIVASEGEIMLPRKVTMNKNAPELAAKFVANVLAKRKGRA